MSETPAPRTAAELFAALAAERKAERDAKIISPEAASFVDALVPNPPKNPEAHMLMTEGAGALYFGLSYAEYDARCKGLSVSRLKEVAKSPMAYLHRLTHPKESDALRIGSAAHLAILEPHRIESELAVWRGGRRQGKEWDAWAAAHAGVLQLNEAEEADVLGMRNSVRQFAPAMRYLREGKAEVSMVWTDPETGRAKRGRMDWLTTGIDGKPVIVDLKTARDCRAWQFGSQVAKLGYHMQFAYYTDGYFAITGELPSVKVIVVESTAPYEPAVYSVPDEVIVAGRDEVRRLEGILAECEASGKWPPLFEIEQELSLPSWALGDDEDDLSGLGFTA